MTVSRLIVGLYPVKRSDRIPHHSVGKHLNPLFESIVSFLSLSLFRIRNLRGGSCALLDLQHEVS